MDWLCRAQEAAGGRGVSAGYFLKRGWMPPYPEVTGYIIPTFLQYAACSGREEFVDRAIRMGEWEAEIQLANGAVRGGIGLREYPIVFNTGQVLLGWLSLFRATGEQRFLHCACRGAIWLVENQDEDGKWSRHVYKHHPHSYHARVAWALLETGTAAGEPRFRQAAERHLNWILSQRTKSDWIQMMGFAPDESPLTHTIAYTIRGMLESAPHLDPPLKARILEAAQTVAAGLLAKFQALDEGDLLPARFDQHLESSDAYSCLTGNAQLAIIWLKLPLPSLRDSLVASARRSIDQLKCIQCGPEMPADMAGSLAGSHPLGGAYVPYAFTSWATKFLADALMLYSAQEIDLR